MSVFQEPTNEQLWSQPPESATPATPAVPVVQPSALPAPVPPAAPPVYAAPRNDRGTLGLAIASLGIGIPLSAIASGTAGLPGLIVAWIGIVGVNAVFAWSKRNHG